jgi:hypothetical protein
MLLRIAVLWIIFAAAMGFLAGGSFVSAFLAPQAAEQQSNAREADNSDSTEKRHQVTEDTVANYNKWLMLFTALLAVATVGLVIATVGLVGLAKRQADDMKVIQRAYVKMSHPTPGIQAGGVTGLFGLEVEIKNFGNTPARVTNVLIKPLVLVHNETLAAIPDYSLLEETEGIPKAFLVTQDSFFYSRVYRIRPEDMVSVKDLASDLYLIGFVDYMDQFNQRHRAGYARLYQPMVDDRASYKTDEAFARRNNLFVVSQEGYNYDRLRLHGEGDDWDA